MTAAADQEWNGDDIAGTDQVRPLVGLGSDLDKGGFAFTGNVGLSQGIGQGLCLPGITRILVAAVADDQQGGVFRGQGGAVDQTPQRANQGFGDAGVGADRFTQVDALPAIGANALGDGAGQFQLAGNHFVGDIAFRDHVRDNIYYRCFYFGHDIGDRRVSEDKAFPDFGKKASAADFRGLPDGRFIAAGIAGRAMPQEDQCSRFPDFGGAVSILNHMPCSAVGF